MELPNLYHMIWILLTTLIHSIVTVKPTETPGIKLFKDASFPVSNKVMGRNITCGAHKAGEYPGPTWTCADIRVNGLKIAFGYHPGVSVNGFCTDTKGRVNLGAICRGLLWANQITRSFWAASVSEATCSLTTENRTIVIEKNRDFYWEDFRPGRGWVVTMHCTTKPDE